jgi:hypothetical protein
MSAIAASVHAIEAAWQQEDEAARDRYELGRRKAKLENDAWEKQYTSAKTKGTALPQDPPAKADDPPPLRQLLTNDATPEKLHEIVSQNPAGILVLRDELTGWLAGLEKQGRETERTFALEGWDGNSPHKIERIGRGSVRVPHLCIAYFGGIQPARLMVYQAGTREDSPDDDGLMQRFQLMTWPDPPATWKYIDREPNEKMITNAAEIFRRVAEMDVRTPRILKFSLTAQSFFVAWLEQLENRLRNDENLSPTLQSHLAKYRKLMPSLSLLFAVADASLTGIGQLQSVALDHARRAADVCEYLEAHAIRVYSARIRPETAAAHTLAKKLSQGWRGEEGGFTVREVYRNQWTGLISVEEARAACAVLEDAHWIRRQKPESGEQGGRPPETYLINPKMKDFVSSVSP